MINYCSSIGFFYCCIHRSYNFLQVLPRRCNGFRLCSTGTINWRSISRWKCRSILLIRMLRPSKFIFWCFWTSRLCIYIYMSFHEHKSFFCLALLNSYFRYQAVRWGCMCIDSVTNMNVQSASSNGFDGIFFYNVFCIIWMPKRDTWWFLFFVVII